MSENYSLLEPIPACRDCKHCRLIPGLFHVCQKHYVEELDYIKGIVYAVDMVCIEVRKDKSLCGRNGKDFEQRENPLEEDKPKSTWWHLKQMIKEFF
jgi:hypothetical protein